MKRLIDMYASWMRLHLAHVLQYRAMIAMWQIAGLVEVAVALSVWSAVAASSGGSVDGWARADFVAYFVMVMLINELTHTWTVWMWAWRIGEGTFAGYLLRPVHPVHDDLADNAAVKVLSMSIKTPIAVAVAWWFGAEFHTAAVEWLLLVPALGMAWLIRALVEAMLACTAFWIVRVSALVNGYHVLFILFSGTFAPMAVMPDWLRAVASVLPFRWIVEFPARLATGQLSPNEIAVGFAMQATWVALSWAGFHVTWKAASRRFSAVGS